VRHDGHHSAIVNPNAYSSRLMVGGMARCGTTALVTAFRGNPAHHRALVDELDRAVTKMELLTG
jgi:hypothetical protein